MEVHRGEVFYADLSPVVGSEQGGVRPVLIVQNEIGNRHSPTVIAAAITSRLDKTRLPTHINIRAADTGLAKDSVVLLEQIRTLDKHRLRQRAGQITPEDQKRGQPGPGRQPWAGQRHLTPKMPRPAGGAFLRRKSSPDRTHLPGRDFFDAPAQNAVFRSAFTVPPARNVPKNFLHRRGGQKAAGGQKVTRR